MDESLYGAGNHSFPPESRIKKRRTFLRVRRRGKRNYTKRFLIDLYSSQSGNRRLGVTVSKKVGNAVQRNRVKRWIREVFRQNQNLFPEHQDIVITAKRGIRDFSYATIRDELITFVTHYENPKTRSHASDRPNRRKG